MKSLPKELPALLLDWYAQGHRDLPWRHDREPYHVWLSEIMLQQTRVEAVRSYYTRFLAALPTISALAACDANRLEKLWEGLGYYTRVRNLQRAAQMIVRDYGGEFPRSYADVHSLPGIGDYTAGAICSICFEMPTPAVDGNVLRVLSRVMADAEPVTKQSVKQTYGERLAELYPAGRCGDFTQALMELGATVCVPNGTPDCGECPLSALCLADRQGRQTDFPVRQAKKPRRIEEKTVLVLTSGDCLAVRKRPEKGLLAGLWELPNTEGRLDAEQALDWAQTLGVRPVELLKMTEKTHVFTHVQWDLRGFYMKCAEKSEALTWADDSRLASDVALPTAFRMFLESSPESCMKD